MRRFAIALVVLAGCWTQSTPKPAEPAVTESPPAKTLTRAERWDQSTPRSTIYAFVRAVEQERYDVLLRFVPTAYKDKLTEEQVREQFQKSGMSEVMERLRKDIDNPIREDGDNAVMPYGDRFEVKLVREDGTWRVKDLD